MSEQRSLSDGQNEAASGATRRRIFEVIFLSDSPSGKLFDIVLLVTIAVSVVVVMVESVAVIRVGREQLFRYAEWVFTLLFTALACARAALRAAHRALG